MVDFSLCEKAYEAKPIHHKMHRPRLSHYNFSSPSQPISRVISSICSSGNEGEETGFIASDISFMELSSAAIRFLFLYSSMAMNTVKLEVIFL